jgi:hypothetical protein
MVKALKCDVFPVPRSQKDRYNITMTFPTIYPLPATIRNRNSEFNKKKNIKKIPLVYFDPEIVLYPYDVTLNSPYLPSLEKIYISSSSTIYKPEPAVQKNAAVF